MKKSRLVRMLAANQVDGRFYRANDVVEVPPGTRQALIDAGHADGHPDAVTYCLESLGVAPQVHKVPAADSEVVSADPSSDAGGSPPTGQ